MSNDYILKQVPSKLRIADVTMNISMTYRICSLHVFEHFLFLSKVEYYWL